MTRPRREEIGDGIAARASDPAGAEHSSAAGSEREAEWRPLTRRGFLKGIALSAGAAAAVPAEGVFGKAIEPFTAPSLEDGVGPGPVLMELEVNGRKHRVRAEPRVTLLDVLRNYTAAGEADHDYLDVTGPKRVCDRSSCGACTVLLDGLPVYACSVLAIEAQGHKIQTVEGLVQEEATDSGLHPVQEAFVHTDGLMCGFCTPGLVVAAKALLDRNPKPSPEELRRGLDGNICRCGTYNRVFEAVLLAASKKTRR